jgi:hypothetical protein
MHVQGIFELLHGVESVRHCTYLRVILPRGMQHDRRTQVALAEGSKHNIPCFRQ